MKNPFRSYLFFGTLFIGFFFLVPQIQAAKPIARVASFKGQVLIQSGTALVPVKRVGQFLYAGDRIQTKKGQVQVTFNDGAIIKVSPYTNTLIQEREEKRGFWVFKSKKTVRRITAFVGKLWFKSGASKRKNYLQTPTAVCGIRGSDGDFGFDNQKSYLKMYTGTAKVTGKVIRSRFKNPGKRAADKNPVYRRVERAYAVTIKARTTRKPADIAKAKVVALHVAKEASKVIKEKNPDETVRKIDGEIAGTAADAGIAKEKVAVSVEELKENHRHLQQAIANAKDEKEAQMIEKALNDAVKAIGSAEKRFSEADRIVKQVHDMAARHDMEAMRHAAEAVQKIDGDVRKMYMDMTEDTKNMFKEMGFVPPAPGMRPPGEHPPGMQPPPGWDPSKGPPPTGMYPPGWDPSKGPPPEGMYPPGWDPSMGPPPGEYGMYPPGEHPPGEHPPGMYPPGEYPPEYGMYPPPGDYPPGEYPPEYGMYPPPGDYPPGEYPPEYGMYPPPPGDYPPGEYPPPGEYGEYPPPPGDYVYDPYYDAYDPHYDYYGDPCAGSDPCDWNCDGVVDEFELKECSSQGIDSGANDGYDYCDYNLDGVVDAYEFDWCNQYSQYEPSVHDVCHNIKNQDGSINSGVLADCFNMADTNNDGKIDYSEATVAGMDDFYRLDKNMDGFLTMSEGEEVLDNCDTNDDGYIDSYEASVCGSILSDYH